MKSDDLKIEKGIPIPPRHKHSGASNILRKLKKGDSVWLECSIQSATSLCYQVNDDKSVFTRRRENDGTRVWRVK